MTVTLHLGDCLQYMKSMPDKSVDAVITDPPYNINKAEWDKIDNYIEWCGEWIIECQRILKDNGSFYFFHNDMEQIADLMLWIRNNTRFVFKSFIVIDKTDNSYIIDLYKSQNHFRNYLNLAEYCLFYTFQDETGLTTVKLDMNNFSSLRQYFKDYQESLGMSKTDILEAIGQQADHCFRWGSSQWDMPTAETYAEIGRLPLKYEFVRKEYEDLRKEYEDLRYTFNKKDGIKNVWQYSFSDDKKCKHPTQKPISLMSDIIKYSSNVNDTVFDPFIGSGTTGVACVQLGRNFIGCEIDPKYFAIAEKRIAEAQLQPRLLDVENKQDWKQDALEA